MENAYDNSNNKYAGKVKIPSNYKPNEEEQKLLAQCRAESNMKGIIGAVLTGGVVYQSIKSFNLTTSSKFGIWPKVGSACLFGFFCGKLMAIPSCYEKFQHLSNSPIGAIIRQQRASVSERFRNFDSEQNLQAGSASDRLVSLLMDSATDANSNFAIVNTPANTGDSQMNSAIDIDVYSSPSNMDSYTGDELNGPNSGAPIDNLLDQTHANKPAVSYAELRQRHRDEYSRAEKERYNLGSSTTNIIPAPAAQPTRRSTPVIPTEKKNVYGDVWE